MNIGVVIDNDLNGDIRVLREIRILKGHGFDVSVLCFGFSGKRYDVPVEGIKITRIRISRKLKDTLFFFMNLVPVYEWMWSAHIRRFISRNKTDALHVHDMYMSRATHEGVRSSKKKIPVILDLHENYPFQVTTYNWTRGFLRSILSRPFSWKKKEHEYLSYADKIVVLSSDYRDSLIAEYPQLTEDRFVVFPNVPDITAPEYTNKTRVENPFANEHPLLLYYGVIAERRGIFETLKVFSGLLKNSHEVNLLLIGPVDKKDRDRFNEALSENHLKGKLIHIPWISSKDFPGYLGISDICLAPFRKNPQHESGVANKIYDYMLGGKPLIVSDCRPQKNLVEKYNCGLVFKDENEFSKAIIRLVSDRELRENMGLNGRTAIMEHHNINVFKKEFLSMYKDLNL